MPDDKNPIITGGKEPLIRVPLFILKRSRQIILMVIALTVLTAIGLTYKQKLDDKQRTPTVILNGKEVPAPILTGGIQPNSDDAPVDYAEVAKKLEAKIAAGQPSYLDYLTLAQLYGRVANEAKAIENYEKAKKAADPNMPHYQSFIASIDESIKYLREN